MNFVSRFLLLILSCVLLFSYPVLSRSRKSEQENFWINFDDMDMDFEKEFNEEEEKKSNKHVNDPDMNKDPCEIIRARGFICQPHHPVTNDGYILTLYRIINPYTIHSKTKRPLLLMHGLLGSSADFVIGSGTGAPYPPPPKGHPYIPRTNNLGFELSNHGYDVWLGNWRGNWYSQNHTKYSCHDRKFWEFSFDDHVNHDLPCSIGHILLTTGHTSLGYIGHSMGGGAMLALLASQPHLYTHVIKPFIGLAPQSRLKMTRSSGLNSVQNFGPLVDSILMSMTGPFPVPIGTSNFGWNMLCSNGMKGMCQNFFAESSGFVGYGNINSTRFPVYISHYPQTTSTWVIAYFVQSKRNSRFMKFDYLSDEDNYKHHHQTRVPEYRMDQIRSKDIAVFWSRHDSVVTSGDIKWLLSKLTVPTLDVYEIPKREKWTHGDYMWAMKAPLVVYQRMIRLLDSYESEIVIERSVNLNTAQFKQKLHPLDSSSFYTSSFHHHV